MASRPRQERRGQDAAPGGGFKLTDERGSGLISTVFGVLMFLLFLLLGAHVLMHLYAASILTVNAFDAARTVSGAGAGTDRAAAEAAAEAETRRRLGAFAERVGRFDWSKTTADDVVLTIRVDTPDLLPDRLATLMGMDTFTRTVRLRVEVFR